MRSQRLTNSSHYKFNFYRAKPKTRLNRRQLIRTNSIYDDGSDAEERKESPFRASLSFLFANITLHCYNHLMEKGRPALEKIFWLVVHALNATFFAYIIKLQFDSISDRPLVTSLQDTSYPVKFVPFPAVAICSNSRISLKAAQKFAEKLSRADPQSRNASYFMDSIYLMGSLYDAEAENDYALLQFQEFLEENILLNSTDLTTIVRDLTPDCDDLTISCHWAGEQRPCMVSFNNDSSALLRMRRTQYGFCCSFNYNRVDNFTRTFNLTRFEALVTGPELSLIVTLNTSTDDYFFNLFNGPGFRVLIFDENEYPDTLSGGVIEQQVQPGTETYIRVDPISIESSRNILQYGVHTRGCYYPSEVKNRYGGDYTRSSCILNCRLRSLIALCNCVPFYYYVNTYLSDQTAMPPVCTLQNVACLGKYKIKLQMVITKIEAIDGLEREMEEGLYCPECHPSCSRTSYSVKVSSMDLIPQMRNSSVLPSNLTDVSDISVIRVFFGKQETWLYNQDLAQYWFETASLFGGLFGLTAGFSIISGFEIICFVGKHLGGYLYKRIVSMLPKSVQLEKTLIIYP